MTINGEDHGVLGTPLVPSHEAPEALRRKAIGYMGLMLAVALGAIVAVFCCAGAVVTWRLS